MTRVAVIGAGVGGLLAAHVVGRHAEVTLFEADARLGGHAHTHDVDLGSQSVAVDTGFIVHNERTYPVLLRLFAELGVPTRDSEMSLSIRDDVSGIQWAGALGPRGLFPRPGLLLRPDHWRMLVGIPRFHRAARRLLDAPDDLRTLREFLDDAGFGVDFRRHFMEPVVAAVWSCDPQVALEYPARYLFAFLDHHGMLGIFGSPTWRTVVGGSREYVTRVAADLHDVRLGTKVTSVLEHPDGVDVTDGNGTTTRFDAVVIATHPGQALAMLADPTPLQREVLSALPYSTNPALLHTDDSLLPTARPAQASWNFLRTADADRGLVVTYDLTRLQGLPPDRRLFLTLGGDGLVDPTTVIARMEYEHPLYTPTSVAARRRLPEINGRRLAFAGAYHGWGFHEDGARSGLAAAEHLGFTWDAPTPPRLGTYRTTIRHTRRAPFRRTFEHRSYWHLVDVDDAGPGFEARDHLGDPRRTLRENVEQFVGFSPARILLAAHRRAWGSVFNPISVFWCLDERGRQLATVVEVHNTYGDRHAYLLHPDASGRAEVDKAMYVSPFHGVDGRYVVHAPVPGDAIDVGVRLETEDGAVFTASVSATPARVPRWRTSLSSLRGVLLIHAHGAWLWLRRLPVHPRPTHHLEGVRR